MWQDIEGYEGRYQISSAGNVYSYKNDRELKCGINSQGYKMVALSKNNKIKTYPVHRLVATMFIENKDNKHIVNHLDGNKSNNYWLNLEWCTNSENSLHAFKTGLAVSRKGEKHHGAKLTEQNVLEIRKLWKENYRAEYIALKYNLYYTTIYKIIKV